MNSVRLTLLCLAAGSLCCVLLVRYPAGPLHRVRAYWRAHGGWLEAIGLGRPPSSDPGEASGGWPGLESSAGQQAGGIGRTGGPILSSDVSPGGGQDAAGAGALADLAAGEAEARLGAGCVDGPRVDGDAWMLHCYLDWFTLTEAEGGCFGDEACTVLHDFGCDGVQWRYSFSTLDSVQAAGATRSACTKLCKAGVGLLSSQSTAAPAPAAPPAGASGEARDSAIVLLFETEAMTSQKLPALRCAEQYVAQLWKSGVRHRLVGTGAPYIGWGTKWRVMRQALEELAP
ncbi:unnamed protein product [Prorocentrum cordatum]|uniref:Uncharacterized protein n=1 Tax=Prorocentrum cordatum TaxID=2364126 RepID=A0ABN9UX21_9DINO|nr:unnamed protein product [Polarella glacialis]